MDKSYKQGKMTIEEAFYIVGNLPIPPDDKNYDICQYQEAKALCLDATTKQIKQKAEYDGYFGFSTWNCSSCKQDVTNKPNYCPNCGQKLTYS